MALSSASMERYIRGYLATVLREVCTLHIATEQCVFSLMDKLLSTAIDGYIRPAW